MKLASFEIDTPFGSIVRLGCVFETNMVDLTASCAAMLSAEGKTERASEIAEALVPSDMLAFIKGGALCMDYAIRALEFAKSTGGEGLIYSPDAIKLLAPLPVPASIRDTLSFEGHMINFEKRTGKPTPPLWYERPIYYKGNRRTVVGPETEVEWPPFTDKLDFELEFAVVIGKTGRDISVEDAPDYIAGYTIFNDISARDIIPQEVSMNLGPAKGKDMDKGNVLGPYLVTPDELDAVNLNMKARINGEVWSEGNSSDMYHKFPDIISFISQSETLYPGDVIGSGTIANGCGDEVERWIKPGDVIELEVENIGILRNIVGPKRKAK